LSAACEGGAGARFETRNDALDAISRRASDVPSRDLPWRLPKSAVDPFERDGLDRGRRDGGRSGGDRDSVERRGAIARAFGTIVVIAILVEW